MSAPSNTDRSRLTLEVAADWAALAESGSLTEEQRPELEAWLEDPANREAFDQARGTWQLLNLLDGTPELEELRSARPAVAAEMPRRRSPWPWLAAAAALLVTVAGGAMWSRLGPAVYETKIGEQRLVELEDGTVVHLDTATRIVARFAKGRRDVVMETGRALFDVARDPSRPFTVRSGSVAVTALGTQFDVYRREASVDVAVVEGKVKVRSLAAGGETAPAEAPVASRDLARGQMARVERGADDIHVEAVDVHAVIVWTSGVLEFDLTPLPEAIAAFNRYSVHGMRMEDPALGSIRVSGRFHFSDAEGFRASLVRSAPVQTYRASDGTIVITSAQQTH